MKPITFKPPVERFFENLNDLGLFTRDYDAVCQIELPRAAKTLHNQLCHLDLRNLDGWPELSLRDFINAFVDAHNGYRRI